MSHLDTLTRIFSDVLDEPDLEITPETSQDNLADWDSVAHVKLVLTIEMEFGFRFHSDEVATIRSVADFLQAIDQHLVR